MSPPRHPLVLGLGNLDRGDDAIGRLVARCLMARQRRAPRLCWLRRIEIAEHDGDVAGLLERLEDASTALLIDACRTGTEHGTIHRFDANCTSLPGAADSSTHGLGLASALELARVLGRLPSRCIIFGVEAQRFTPGSSLSRGVACALEPIVQRVIAELAASGNEACSACVNAACPVPLSLAGVRHAAGGRRA